MTHIDYPSTLAEWALPQDNLIGLTTTKKGLHGKDGSMTVSPAGPNNRKSPVSYTHLTLPTKA